MTLSADKTTDTTELCVRPKMYIWDPEKAGRAEPEVIRRELERQMHIAIQANLHPVISALMQKFPSEDTLFLDVDAGEGIVV